MKGNQAQLLRILFYSLVGIGVYLLYTFSKERPEIKLDFLVYFAVGFVIGGIIKLSINVYRSRTSNQPFELASNLRFNLVGGLLFSALSLLGILPALI